MSALHWTQETLCSVNKTDVVCCSKSHSQRSRAGSLAGLQSKKRQAPPWSPPGLAVGPSKQLSSVLKTLSFTSNPVPLSSLPVCRLRADCSNAIPWGGANKLLSAAHSTQEAAGWLGLSLLTNSCAWTVGLVGTTSA